jgi:hypothetical protein
MPCASSSGSFSAARTSVSALWSGTLIPLPFKAAINCGPELRLSLGSPNQSRTAFSAASSLGLTAW